MGQIFGRKSKSPKSKTLGHRGANGEGNHYIVAANVAEDFIPHGATIYVYTRSG